VTVAEKKPRDKDPVLIVTFRPPGVKPGTKKFADLNREARERLKSMSYTEALEESSELEMTFENEDLFWIDETGGADLMIEGTLIDFQFGYVDRSDFTDDRLSLIRSHTIVGKPTIARDTITVKGASELQTKFGTVVSPQWAPTSKASDVVRSILSQGGFDEDHRIIQDTKHKVSNIAITTHETILQFCYRMAKAYNYRFFITPGDDGKPIAHFHKAGWFPGKVVKDITAVDQATLQLKVDPAFGEDENGNMPLLKGQITYRPNAPEDSDVLGFTIALEADGTPSTMDMVGADRKEGRSVTGSATEADKNELPLSPRTFHANPEFQSAPASLQTAGSNLAGAYVPTIEAPRPTTDPGVLLDLPPSSLPTPKLPVVLPTPATPVVENEKKTEGTIRGQFLPPTATGGAAIAVVTGMNRDQAKDHVKSALEQAQSEMVVVDMELIGIPHMWAGDLWRIEGLKKYSNNYLVKEVQHSYDATNGYTTNATFTTDGVNAKQAAQSARVKPGAGGVGGQFLVPTSTQGAAIAVVNQDGSTTPDPAGGLDEKAKGE
jgi:hypothetical protein